MVNSGEFWESNWKWVKGILPSHSQASGMFGYLWSAVTRKVSNVEVGGTLCLRGWDLQARLCQGLSTYLVIQEPHVCPRVTLSELSHCG